MNDEMWRKRKDEKDEEMKSWNDKPLVVIEKEKEKEKEGRIGKYKGKDRIQFDGNVWEMVD